MEKVKANLNVAIEVSGTNYTNNGKLKTVFGGKGQISKRDNDRTMRNETDTISIRATDCGGAKMEGEYKSSAIGKGEVQTDVELELKGQQFDMNKGELIDAIAAGSKLTKADAGRALDTAIEDIHKLLATRSCEAECATVESTYETKTVEIVK